jgi:hypothetical protein
MFDGCESLIETPNIMASICAEGACEYMFMNCIALQEANIPIDPHNISNGVFAGMFKGCTSLSKINTLFSDFIPNDTYANE